jgi:hypothetical protein
MTAVYLINVGANTADTNRARSPIFTNGSFVYVPFSCGSAASFGAAKYPTACVPYLNNGRASFAHVDPHWNDLTYGDVVSGARGSSLASAGVGDILLFWGLLWENRGIGWAGFTGDRAWYLFGAIRIEGIIEGGTRSRDVPRRFKSRTSRNAHFIRGMVPYGHRVFIGERRYSSKFQRAVPLDFHRPNGLAYRTCTDSATNLLTHRGKPHWRSSLRGCRRMWDLENRIQRARANVVRRAIERLNRIDIFADVNGVL